MDNTVKQQLEDLVGTTVFYSGQNHKIEKWKLVGGNYCIVTDHRTLQFYPAEIQTKFLDKIEDEQAAEVIKKFSGPKTEIAPVRLPEENTTIKNMLMDMMQKVKENPAFLAQAKSMCEITNTMVNVQKVELDMIKLQKDL